MFRSVPFLLGISVFASFLSLAAFFLILNFDRFDLNQGQLLFWRLGTLMAVGLKWSIIIALWGASDS